MPAPVWFGEAVAEADGATLTAARVLDECRSGLTAAEGLGRPELAAADGLGWSALSSELVLIVAELNC